MEVCFRSEAAEDAKQIHQVTELAFRDAPHTAGTEQFIVDALRRAGALAVSLVAEIDGKIVGHVALSPVEVSDGAAGWFGLGPISVLPEFQGRGIGSELMRRALAELEGRGAAGCVLVGEPAFYGRFGFKTVDQLRYPEVPAEYFQAMSFNGSYPQGEVTFHEAFAAQA